ncbi:hypothetical protein VNO80_15455 [Phaseolus coccineus]|uniref:Uncharacterized protein n=1 Tax=Phaseolus coccineus TaxID=3886 RepID=A0AAN9MQ05_PHACN
MFLFSSLLFLLLHWKFRIGCIWFHLFRLIFGQRSGLFQFGVPFFRCGDLGFLVLLLLNLAQQSTLIANQGCFMVR